MLNKTKIFSTNFGVLLLAEKGNVVGRLEPVRDPAGFQAIPRFSPFCSCVFIILDLFYLAVEKF